MIKSILFALAVISLTSTISACNDKGSDDPCAEMALQVSTTPVDGSVEAPGIGPDFPLQVNVNNGMPSMGVTIEVSVSKESGGAPFFTQTLANVSATTSNLTITGSTAGTTNIVKVIVTSRSCASNHWSGSYRYSMK